MTLCFRRTRLRRAASSFFERATKLATAIGAGGAIALALPTSAHADASEPPVASEASAIRLVVRGDPLPSEQLRDAVARELGRPVLLVTADEPRPAGTITVTYRRAASELAVTWDDPRHGTMSRVIAARARSQDVVVDAALLAGNLARDEVDDVIAPPPPLPASSDATPVSAARSSQPHEPERPASDAETLGFNVGLFYPLAANSQRPWARTHFDFNVFQSRIGQLDGVQIGGANFVAPDGERGTGAVNGLQIGYAFNAATRLEGVQLSPFVNIVTQDAAGIQLGGLFNYTRGDIAGGQLGFVNATTGAINGGQLSIINIGGDVSGAQVGLVNVARNVSGAMVGVVNVADHVDGVPFGLASVTKDGGVHPAMWGGTGSFANIGVKLATRHTYTMPMAHYHYAYDRDFVGAGFAIGGRIPLSDTWNIDTDLGFSWLSAPKRSFTAGDPADTYHEHLLQPRLRAMVSARVAPHFGVFLGPSLLPQIRLERDMEKVTVRVGPELVGGIEL